jgi:hypothetical protein
MWIRNHQTLSLLSTNPASNQPVSALLLLSIPLLLLLRARTLLIDTPALL